MIDAAKYGPWAIVVGGSESLGASFAHQIAAVGINLILVARKEGPLEAVAESVRAASGVEVRTLSLDLARDDMLDRIRAVSDDVDVGLLVYNAGAAHRTGPFLAGTLDDALRTLRVNNVGQVSLAHHFGAKMVARGRGGIIISGSIAGSAGGVGIVTYSAAKAFAQIFAEGLWIELKSQGVDVLEVPLGAMNSPAMARIGIHYGPDRMPSEPDDQAREILDNIANGPVFVPPHLVEAFRYCASLPRDQAAMEGSKRMDDIEDTPAPAQA
jgi:short-subunit dehydrogenase